MPNSEVDSSSDSPSPVLVEHRGAICILTINRPRQSNALDPAAIKALFLSMRSAADDPEVAVVVLTGTGERSFCGGIDLKVMAAAGAQPVTASLPGLSVLLREAFPKPIVAAVNGSAVAAGLELMLACDVIVASEHAQFGLPEVKRGLAAGRGLELLPRRVPIAVALEMALTGDFIDANRAAAIGLVNYVVPAKSVLAEAVLLAERIARNAPLAVRFSKEKMRQACDGAQDEAADLEFLAMLNVILSSDDAREGTRAWAEGRPPVWSGR
ncbi:MAG: 2,3-dehydroadipyl-CoA hydratase [Nitrospira sp.]|nr:2,3-dehydroadipyl-CoA hydratase [Nitrospira sp.]